MRTMLTALTLVAATLAGSQAQPRMLTVDFVALDKKGNPVADLRPTEVEVWIGQFRAPVQQMTVVTPEADERGGRVIVLLLDDMTVPLEWMPRVREAARQLVTRMGGNDRMAVLTMSGSRSETTAERNTLLRAIDSYAVRATPLMRTDTLGRQVLETMGSIAGSLIEAPGRRKTIVAIGSGWLFDRPVPPPVVGQDLLPEWIRAMRQMAVSHVNLYVIDPSGLTGRRADSGDQGLARETGGHAFLNTNDISGAVDRILRESANFYMVDVPDPPVGEKADLRPLELKSLRRGVTLRARHGIAGSF